MPVRAPIAILAALSIAAAAIAQSKQPATPDKPAKDAAPAPSQTPDWPKKVEKNLYGKDLRGQKAPEITVAQTLTGTMPDHKGKVVLVEFWATWCPPCRESIPELNELQKKFKDDLVVIGISDESEAKVRDFMKKTPMEYTVAIDPAKTMNKQVEVKGIPHALLISTDGVVRWQGFPLSEEERLTDSIVKQVIDADPGVKARHEAAHDQKDAKPADAAKPSDKPKDTTPH